LTGACDAAAVALALNDLSAGAVAPDECVPLDVGKAEDDTLDDTTALCDLNALRESLGEPVDLAVALAVAVVPSVRVARSDADTEPVPVVVAVGLTLFESVVPRDAVGEGDAIEDAV